MLNYVSNFQIWRDKVDETDTLKIFTWKNILFLYLYFILFGPVHPFQGERDWSGPGQSFKLIIFVNRKRNNFFLINFWIKSFV